MENKKDYGKIRREYLGAPLDLDQLHADPVIQFQSWFEDALNAGVIEPNAVSLATVDKTGMPDVRIVLFKGLSDHKITFFTNYNSKKAADMQAHPQAALVFFWAELARQVRVRGKVTQLSRAESDEYFQSRPRYSQIAAWASAQSKVLADRKELEDNFAFYLKKFGEKNPVPTPEDWGGYVLDATEWEFWQGRENRMHDRFRYTHRDNQPFLIERLNP